MCPFWGLAEGAQIPGEALLEETADGLEEKSSDTSAFQSSDGNTSAKVPLAKPSHTARPKIKVWQSMLHPPGAEACHVTQCQWER